jgi:hypothetical protein
MLSTMATPTSTPTPSSAALDVLLDLDGDPDAKAVRARFNRSHLHVLRRGQKKPDADTALQIDMLTRGRVPAVGWGTLDTKTIEILRRKAAANETGPKSAA